MDGHVADIMHAMGKVGRATGTMGMGGVGEERRPTRSWRGGLRVGDVAPIVEASLESAAANAHAVRFEASGLESSHFT